MLPERLSNELCSLRPNETSLCFSAVFTLDENLEILDEWFGRTVIHSDRRFTYAEAQEVIETGRGDYAEEILTLNRLAQGLRRQRFRNGAISFDREEVKFRLDENGRPLGIYFKEQKESNQMIEEFMLLANRRVAEFCSHRRSEKGRAVPRTMVYRVHDTPSEEKLDRFRQFILRFGHVFKASKGRAVAREMKKLFAQIKGSTEENAVSTMAVRAMAKAYYSTDNIGHYGLAFPCYTHFTSPIRRYPDMMVHRLLAHYLAGGKSADKAEIDALCERASDREVIAAEAERASIKYKMVEFMKEHIGEEFEGHISGGLTGGRLCGAGRDAHRGHVVPAGHRRRLLLPSRRRPTRSSAAPRAAASRWATPAHPRQARRLAEAAARLRAAAARSPGPAQRAETRFPRVARQPHRRRERGRVTRLERRRIAPLIAPERAVGLRPERLEGTPRRTQRIPEPHGVCRTNIGCPENGDPLPHDCGRGDRFGGPGRPETWRAYSITAAQPPLRTIFTGIRIEASTMRTRRL